MEADQFVMSGKDTDVIQYFQSEKNRIMTLIKYSDSYTNFLKILLITSFIFEVPNTNTK